MRGRKKAPPSPTNQEIIDAIFKTIMDAADSVPNHSPFEVPASHIPEVANNFTNYHLERVAMKLDRLGIMIRYNSFTKGGRTFYFRKS